MNEEEKKTLDQILEWNKAHPDNPRIPIYVILPASIVRKAQELSGRRYPGDPMGRDNVISDAITWKLERWRGVSMPLADHFWYLLSLCGIRPLAAFAWGKVIGSYFEEVAE